MTRPCVQVCSRELQDSSNSNKTLGMKWVFLRNSNPGLSSLVAIRLLILKATVELGESNGIGRVKKPQTLLFLWKFSSL